MDMPKISTAEFEVMKVVWARPPVAAQDICHALEQDFHWSPQTVKTLLGRLVKKGALAFTKTGKSYLYEPKLAREACLAAESESFLQRCFGGALDAMVMQFAQSKQLSDRDLNDLKRILNKLD